MYDLRYPIGMFPFQTMKGPFTDEQIREWILDIEKTPGNLRHAVQGLSDEQLDTPYREGGWTIRQVAHHLPDAHMNAYIRFKFALTEDEPHVKPYAEKDWANLPDSQGPIEPSLMLLDGLHERWVSLMKAMKHEDFDRVFQHPDLGKVSLGLTVALYAWHGRHHVAHIRSIRVRMRWS
jgi:uncharacterized damage-inducible protein DinB